MTEELTLERLAGELGHFASTITESERSAARTCVADALACAAAGVDSDVHRRSVIAFAAEDDALHGRATVWFIGRRADSPNAAYLNSVAVSAHDLDDGHRGAVGHPGGAIIPAAIAELEAAGSTVDLLDAIIVGYEAALRIAEARDPTRFERSATGRWASFGVAATSCFIHQDPPATVAHALAHAASLAPQLTAPDHRRPDGLKEGTPWAIVAGLIAARLARVGIPGPTYALEHRRAYTADRLARVGARHPGAITETYFKRYACCRWIHPVLDCLFALADADPFDVEAIDEIHVTTFDRSLKLPNEPAPTTLEAAHYSFPFCVGLALTEGPGAFLPLQPSALSNHGAIALARRVRIAVDPRLTARFPRYTPGVVRVVSGTSVREMTIDTAHGDPSLPFPRSSLQHKFDHLAQATHPLVATLAAAITDGRRPVDLDAILPSVLAHGSDREVAEHR